MKRLCAISISISLFACNSNGRTAAPPVVDDTARTGSGAERSMPGSERQGRSPEPSPHRGMTTGQKVVVLGGAAALYYLYKHHQSANAQQGPDSQYYLSKNGRVYYRDADHRAHWVTPPPEGLRVPESEAGEYRQFQGYDGNANGRDLAGLSNDE